MLCLRSLVERMWGGRIEKRHCETIIVEKVRQGHNIPYSNYQLRLNSIADVAARKLQRRVSFFLPYRPPAWGESQSSHNQVMLGGLTWQWKLLQTSPLTVLMALQKQRPFFRSALPAMSAISQRRSPVDFSHQVLGKTEFARQIEMSFDVASVMFHLHRSKPCWKVIEFHGLPTFCNKRQQLGLHLLRGCNPQHPRCYVAQTEFQRLLRPGHLRHLGHLEGTASHLSCLQGFPHFRLLSETQDIDRFDEPW